MNTVYSIQIGLGNDKGESGLAGVAGATLGEHVLLKVRCALELMWRQSDRKVNDDAGIGVVIQDTPQRGAQFSAMSEVGNSLASLTSATIFVQPPPTGELADMVVAADTAAEDRVAADWAHMAEFASKLDMPGKGPEVVAAVAVLAQLRGSYAG
jgi:hypothetical protein